MGSPRAVYFPDLDGWRFVAFLSVFLYHGFHTEFTHIKENAVYQAIKGTFRNGNLGVDFFFVLSGFLIIYLLISEKQLTGRIDPKSFYIRRILRIFPLYYFCVFFGFVIFPFLKRLIGEVPVESADPLWYVTFLSNIDIVNKGVLPDSSVLGVLWSVSVEEQFYLTVPWILITVPLRFYAPIFLSVIAASWIFRANNLDYQLALSMHTYSAMGDLAIGGLSAYYALTGERLRRFFEDLPSPLIKAIYASAILAFLFRQQIFSIWPLRVMDSSMIGLLFAAIILEQNYAKHSFFKMRNVRLFSRLGKYTYGLYCLHIIAAIVILQFTAAVGINNALWQIVAIEMPLMFVLTVFMAYMSYEYFEKPFLRLKERFAVIRKS